MIKSKLTQLALILAVPFVYAQTTATTNLKVILNPLLSISVSTPEVVIDVATEEAYIDGKDILINDHISTFSTSSFEVNVRTLAGNLSGNTGSIEASKVRVDASGVNGVVYSGAVLSESGATLMTSSVGRGRKFHDVRYTLDGELWDNGVGEMSVQVQYEIVAL